MSDILALKYRPRKLSDLVGQKAVAQTLANAVNEDKIYNSQLFVGAWGCGKTSSARILAACLNCEANKKPTTEPCGTCDNCVAIFEGRSLDVKEINAAENRGIDDVRSIKEEATYRATNSRYKVFIIDEAHSLTREAVEAFLKVLEEAPDGVKFVFCTTDYHKIKNTIRSRSQTHFFSLIPTQDIAAHLKGIASVEGIKIDDGALRVVAKMAKGHMRDALKHLDTLVQYSGDKSITAEEAQKALHTVDDTKYFDLIGAIAKKDMPTGYRSIQEMLLFGQDVDGVLNGLLEHIRILMLIRTCESTAGLLSLSPEEKVRYVEQAKLIPPSVLVDIMGYLIDVHRSITFNMNPQPMLERWLLKSTRAYFQAKQQEAATK